MTRARLLIGSALLFLALFVAWTVWRVDTGAHWLDANATRVTGFVLKGWFDAFVSSLWPFGEPEPSVVAVALFTAWLITQGRWRAAFWLVFCFGVLTATELSLRVAVGLAEGERSIRHALVHVYPSGHAARIPFLGTVLALLVPRRWRAPVLAATAALTVLEAFDRIDSTLQTASDVIGGTLMGIWLVFTFAALLPRVERASIGRRT